MAKRNAPTKTRLKKASSYISNTKRSESDDTRKEQIERMLGGQEFVDKWNTERIGTIGMHNHNLTKHFDNIQLEDGMVIQMYMENPIKQIARDSESGEVLHIEWGLRQIDARKRNTDKDLWMTTPFPLIDKGIIMAIAPRISMWYWEAKEKLAKFDPEAAEKMLIPKVGDVIYTKQFLFKNKRYYMDKQKQCEDFVKNQEEIRLKEFDFLFLIDNFDIESIVRTDAIDEMSDAQVLIDNRYIEITPDPIKIDEDLDLTENLIGDE